MEEPLEFFNLVWKSLMFFSHFSFNLFDKIIYFFTNCLDLAFKGAMDILNLTKGYISICIVSQSHRYASW